jgi:hypothetical protein
MSPAKTVAAIVSAKGRAPPFPLHPSNSKHSLAVPFWLPPPTVPTIKDGIVTDA